MRLLRSFALALSLAGPILAHHEASSTSDWYKQLIGVPAHELSWTAPSFQSSGSQELILTTTESNVLAALHPENGTVRWRYVFGDEDKPGGYFRHNNVVATLSGLGGAHLRTFDLSTGELLSERRLHLPPEGIRAERYPRIKHIAFSADSKDLYVLTNGENLRRIDALTGEIKWTWKSPDQLSTARFSKIVLTPDVVYAVGFARKGSPFRFHFASVSPETGKMIEWFQPDSDILNPNKDFVIFQRPDLSRPVVLWLDGGALAVRYLTLTPNLREQSVKLDGIYSGLVDIGQGNLGQVVLTRKDGSSYLLRWQSEGAAETLHDFGIPSEGVQPAYYGYIGSSERYYVSEVVHDPSTQHAHATVFAEQFKTVKELPKFSFPFDKRTNGGIRHIAASVESQADGSIKPHFLVSAETGSVQLWSEGRVKWKREEALASIAAAEFVEFPEQQAAETLHAESKESFFGRLARHVVDAQSFPQYAVHFLTRFTTGSYAASPSGAGLSPSGTADDAFGFRQVIVAATDNSKVFGIDSSTGEIIWSRIFGLGWAEEVGGVVIPARLYVTKTISDGGRPEVVVVGQRHASNKLVDTVIFHIDAITGQDLVDGRDPTAPLQGYELIQGALVNAYLLNALDTRIVIALDEFLQVYLYPDNPTTRDVFTKLVPNITLPLRTGVEDRLRVMGEAIDYDPSSGQKATASPIWTLTFPHGENVIDVLSPTTGPIASFGKVLGDRTTLYKYLNPRLTTVLTADPERRICGLYVVDGTKGTTVYHTEIKQSFSGCNIKTLLVENWLIYHYFESEVPGGTAGGAKGWRMASIEFYEGQKVDEKIRSSELSSYSNDTLNFHTYERSWVFPHGVTALATTQTKFGITSKDIIVATQNNRIQTFPRRLLDPRRPSRKVTSEEQEEGLFPYDPVLPNDPRRVLSGDHDVVNVRGITTSPALLESTSLVFAYGLDLYLTRVAPSGTFDVLSKSFNKAQLVFTVSGLLLAIAITKPMVERKRLREKWYHS